MPEYCVNSIIMIKLNPNIFFLCEIVQFYSMRGRMNNTVNGEDPYYIEGEEA